MALVNDLPTPATTASLTMIDNWRLAHHQAMAIAQLRMQPQHVSEDIMLAKLRADIRKFQALSFHNYGLHLGVDPDMDSAGAYQYGLPIGRSKYRFNVEGEETRLGVTEGDAGEVLLLAGDACISVEDFVGSRLRELTAIIPWREADTDDTCALTLGSKQLLWEQQFSWWVRNGKSFRFLDLPVELRHQVLREVFRNPIYPFPRNRCRRLTGLGAHALASRNPSIGFLTLNKQYFQEATEIIHTSSTFVVDHHAVLERMAETNMTLRIKHLALLLENEEYLSLFGFTSTGADIFYQTHSIAESLHHMKLRRLTVHIKMHTRACAHDDDYCQTTFAGWVLQAAMPFVKYHPVVIEGFARTWQKRSFAVKSAEAGVGYKKWLDLKPLGFVHGTPAEYCEWIADDGGVGVNLGASTDDFLAEKAGTSDDTDGHDKDGRCQCPVKCMTDESWIAANVLEHDGPCTKAQHH